MADLLAAAAAYAVREQVGLVHEFWQHLWLSGAALGVAMLLALPAGVWITRRAAAAEGVIGVFNGLRVVPSLAIMFLALPFLGIGATPAIAALTILACPPILLNTYAGFRGLDPAVLEAARGMGMSPWEVWWRVELPLAAPVVLAGIRMAAVEVLASTIVAAYIGAGGLGVYLLRGFAVRRGEIILVAALPVACLTLFTETVLGAAQRRLTRWA